MPTGSEVREMFLRYFEGKGHRRVHSSSLVPANDPTLLFTNAGMNQFKDVFLGLEKRDYVRATTAQKCVRAGGKHNDLENVGFTNRHHTFFEMLGNFSFGDYFKKEAIEYAWELITGKQWSNLPKEKLYFTVFEGAQGIPRDEEAEKGWLAVGAPKERVFAMGMKDNFWQMGDTGPCGPCSEIHYDMGPAASDLGHADCAFSCDCGRYVEIWNLVFMQFNRYCIYERDTAFRSEEDKKMHEEKGHVLDCLRLEDLPKPCVDTGAGLERVTAVLQGKISNYDTNLFVPLMQRAAELCGVDLQKELTVESYSKSAASLRVIADHARACTFLISDGVLPSNEWRGYALRKILRRGIRHGRLLGASKPFMYEMAHAVRDQMKDAYPELVESAERVSKVIYEEERRFASTLARGEQEFEKLAHETWLGWVHESINSFGFAPDAGGVNNCWHLLVPGHAESDLRLAADKMYGLLGTGIAATFLKHYKEYAANNPPVFSGWDGFKLYDSLGWPLDLIQDSVRDSGLLFDEKGFEQAMKEQRERARASWKGGSGKAAALPIFRELRKTEFEGYRQTESRACEVLAILRSAQGLENVGSGAEPGFAGIGAGAVVSVPELRPGQHGEVVLDHTPFYAESGGQVGDVGWFYEPGTRALMADVLGCTSPVQGVRAHKVLAHQPIQVGQKIDAVVNAEIRQDTMRNHTATHLLHAALRETLGKHVKQAGSLVDPKHLRFDFSHFTHVADEELQDIEELTNKEVLKNTKIEVIEDVPIDVAINEYKAMALFGEKYGERVRVVRIGDFSTELCGGTHTLQTGEIGLVKILSEGSVSSGVRRVEAVTGEGSLDHFRKDHELERAVATLVRTDSESPAAAVRGELERREEEIKRLKKELDQARMKSAAASAAAAEASAREVNGIKVMVHRVDNLERPQMRTLVDNLRNKLGSGVVVLGSVSEVESEGEAGAKIREKKIALIAGVTKDLTAKIQAGKIIAPIAKKVGGSGGGRPDLAEAGGKDVSQLDAALQEAYAVVETLTK